MKKNKCGLTFVEIMISIGVLSVLGLAIFKLMTYANENTAKSRCRSDLR